MVSRKDATFGQALFVFVFLAVSLLVTIKVFGGSPHIPLLMTAVVAGSIGLVNKMPWDDIQEGITEAFKNASPAIVIMTIIGAVIGTWIAGGIVPALIYYGLKVISPDYFLVSSCLICSVVSLSTGSSWSTVGTIGLALMGVGAGLEMNPAMTAGAVISGAYFGDKLSPLSDTTNLAPAMAGSKLFEHIKHMLYTTIPSYFVALALFLFLDMSKSGSASVENVAALSTVLSTNFNISPLLLLVPVLTMAMIGFRVPAIPGLVAVALLGAVSALLFQGGDVSSVIKAAHYGFSIDTGSGMADKLLNRGGIHSMMWTISLIIIALCFAGIVEKTGMILVVAKKILKMATTSGSLVCATIVTTMFTNFASGVQYVALIVPGRLFRSEYSERGLHPKNLSRALEDSGTLVAPLVPYGTDGAFLMGVLGVSPFAYIPFCFFNMCSPIISILLGFAGWTIEPLEQEAEEKAIGPFAQEFAKTKDGMAN
ncbi:Na+/H+ antiporter NhaC [Desulforhopalus singaporensis]|uniref:Na+:H+ antiporter, NhaC family n=1 Tax=Desulforhopalus singaporensis TaxID=91360 RepID=A0A1H0RPL7_9BACT|nr:Na+/H+ antiporter NhaC [Desulforhopalus singaporensis]SDP30906.1 Na+:H+ antiporter, NhaC family [Desulforhopalus singaporensis]